MEREDYIMRQIMMISLFLRKLISRLLHLKEEVQEDVLLETVRTSFNDELKINFDELIFLNDDDFFAILKENHFSNNNLEELAQMLMILGRNDNIEISLSKNIYLVKALSIYLKLEMESQTYSTERNDKIATIREIINRN